MVQGIYTTNSRRQIIETVGKISSFSLNEKDSIHSFLNWGKESQSELGM